MNSLFDVSSKVALVTGGSQGLGRMIAEGLLGVGARVYFTSRKPEQCAQALQELRELGDCHAIVGDLATAEGATAVAKEFAKREQGLHLLINNAGRTWGAPLESFPDSAWPAVMSVNVQTPFTLLRDLLPQLRHAASAENPARVINISSLAGVAVELRSAYSYSASKAAILHLTRVLAAELSTDHITVNCLVPGYFPTRMTAHIHGDGEKLHQTEERIPLGRFGEAEDIVGACIYLASRAGAYVTGISLPVDGGMSGCR